METSNPLIIATNNKRVGAFVIDDMIIAVLLMIIFYPQLMSIASHLPTTLTPEAMDSFKNEFNQFSINNLYLILSLKIIYHTFFVWQNGMTLGKYFMKIKVVEEKSMTTPTLHKALLRAILRIISEMVFYLGFVLAFFIPLNQTLHDKLSFCVVVDV